MAQEMKKLGLIMLAFSLLGGGACSRQGTEVGSPGTSRTINGKLIAESGQGLQSFGTQGLTESCPTTNGPVSVLLVNEADQIITGNAAADGIFSTDILRNDRYEILFAQGDEICGFLIYPDSENLNGLRVTLGKGTLNIDLGDVTDLGGGIFISSMNPSDFCDDDGDGIFDSDDFDDDGDGFFDSDEDFDGYLDWFDDDDDGDGIFDVDEIDDDEFEDACEVAYIYPSMASGLFLEPDGFAEIEIYTNDDISSVNASQIKILDAFDDIVVSFTSDDVTIEDEDAVAILQVNLDPDTDYLLVIPSGAITCSDDNQNQQDLEIEFSTFEND